MISKLRDLFLSSCQSLKKLVIFIFAVSSFIFNVLYTSIGSASAMGAVSKLYFSCNQRFFKVSKRRSSASILNSCAMFSFTVSSNPAFTNICCFFSQAVCPSCKISKIRIRLKAILPVFFSSRIIEMTAVYNLLISKGLLVKAGNILDWFFFALIHFFTLLTFSLCCKGILYCCRRSEISSIAKISAASNKSVNG